MKHAAYCRVSTDEQAKKETIDTQIRLIKEYGERNNIMIEPDLWYLDDGVSGEILLRNRPEGQRLLLDAMEGLFDTLIIARVDRLSREDYTGQEAFKSLKSCRIQLVSLNENFNYFEPTGQAIASVFSVFAALDRNMIKEKFANGKETKALKGKLPQGAVPYGYFINNEQFVEMIPEQADVIRLIYKLYMDENMSIKAICQYLKSMNIPSPATFKPKQFKNRATGNWCEYTVTNILNSEFYSTGSYPFKPPGKNIVLVPVPPIIDQDTYRQARMIAKTKRQNYAPNGKFHTYTLRGFIKCGICGSTYVGSSAKNGRFCHYRCTGRIKLPEGQKCHNPQIIARMIEDLVWDDLKNLFSNPDRLIKEVKKNLQVNKISQDNTSEDVAEIQRRISETHQEKKRLIDLYAKGILQEEDLKIAIGEKEESLAVLTERMNSLDRAMRGQKEQDKSLEMIIDVADEIKDILENADEQTKIDLFSMLLDHIDIYPKEDNSRKIHIFYRVNPSMFNSCRLVK